MVKITRDDNKAEELVITIPILRFINDIVELDIAYPDPNNISLIIDNTFFLFKDSYFLL